MILFLGLLLCSCSRGFAQSYHSQSSIKPMPYSIAEVNYVIIPSSGFEATHVKGKRSVSKGDESLELINVFLSDSFVKQKLVESNDVGIVGLFMQDELLVTMAVLPDPTLGQVQWVEIRLDTVSSVRQIPWEKVADDCYARLFNYKAVGGPEIDWSCRRTDLRPIIKKADRYFTTKQMVLTEYFVLRNYPSWYPTNADKATINCLSKPFTPQDYEKALAEVASFAGKPTPRIRGELSGKLMLQKKENEVYTFWSLHPSIAHGSVAEFGPGELRFRSGVGVVSGKYASYFGLEGLNSTDDKFFEVSSIEQIGK